LNKNLKKLYDRIRDLDIVLKKSHFSLDKSVELFNNRLKLAAKVKISEGGFNFTKI